MSEKTDMMHDRGVECMETFRKGFLSICRDDYALTLIARNKAHPDGSRDMLITQDEPEGIRAAVDLRFPPDAGGAS